MQCPTPLRIHPKRPIVPTKDWVPYFYVPCGKCPVCLQNKANEWAFRLKQELFVSKTSYFITLTYDDEHLPRDDNGNPCFSKTHLQKMLKLLRYYNKKTTDAKIKYFINSEYGSKYCRPHYHCIIFNIADSIDKDELFSKIWPYGYVNFGTCNSKSIAYTTKYALKGTIIKDGRMLPIKLQSKSLGISYIKEKGNFNKQNNAFYALDKQTKINLPRYYREKIFTEDERQQHFNQSTTEYAERFRERVNQFSNDSNKSYYQREVDFLNFQKEIKQQHYRDYIKKLKHKNKL